MTATNNELLGLAFMAFFIITLSSTARYYFKFFCFVVLSVVCAVGPVPLMLLRPRDYRNALLPAYLCTKFGKALGASFEVRGKENVNRQHGGVVLMNHQSALDLVEAAQMMLDASVADETDVSSVNQTSESTLTATDIDLTHAYAERRKPFKNITNSDVSTLSAYSERSSSKQPSSSGVLDTTQQSVKRTNASLDTSARGAPEASRQRHNLTQEPQLKRERSGVSVTSLNSSGRSNGRVLLSLNATQNTQLKRTRVGVLVTSFNSGRSIGHGSPSASLIGSPEKDGEAEDIAAISPIRRKLSAHQLEFTTNTHKEAKETSNNLPAPKRLPTTSSPNRREFPDEDPFGDITVISRNNCLFDDAGFEDAEDEDEGSEEHPEEAEYDAEVDVESDGEESTPYVIHVSLVEQYFMPYANLSLFDDHDPLETIDPLQTNASTSESVIVPKRKLNDNLGGHVDAATAHSAAPTTTLNVPAGDFKDLNIDAIQKKQKKKTTSNRDLRAKGLPYLRRNGTMAPARQLKTPCECKKLKCHETFSDEMRALFFKTFLKLTSSAQNQFLSNHVLIKLVAYHNVVNSRRTYTYTYYLPACGGMLRVCKKMFLSTFDVKSKKMRCLMNKKRSESGIVEDDKRALNHNRYTIPTDEVKFINGHILSFPSCTSHYGREKSSKLFLSSDLSIAAMYRLYVAECTKRETPPVHYNSYKAIFKTYNFAFRTLKVDTCGTCDYLAVSIKGCQHEREKLGLVSKQTDHHQLSKFVFDQKTMDIKTSTTDSTVVTISGDLQKNLPTPHLRSGESYYKRQLYTYNFTLFRSSGGTNTSHCFLWNESIAKRGSQEVASCLKIHFDDPHFDDVKHVNYYTDRCAGQNANFVHCMYFTQLIEQRASCGKALTVEHKYMVSGHSHMEVDGVHGAIERAKRKTSLSVEIPRDWAVLISQVPRKVPLAVYEMEQSQFLAFKNLSCRYKRPKLNDQGEPILFQQAMVFKYTTAAPGVVFYKIDPRAEDFQSFTIIRENVDPELPEMPAITDQPIELSQEKLSDLKSLLKYVSEPNKPYYQALLKNLVAPKRGRKRQNVIDDHFEADLDPLEECW